LYDVTGAKTGMMHRKATSDTPIATSQDAIGAVAVQVLAPDRGRSAGCTEYFVGGARDGKVKAFLISVGQVPSGIYEVLRASKITRIYCLPPAPVKASTPTQSKANDCRSSRAFRSRQRRESKQTQCLERVQEPGLLDAENALFLSWRHHPTSGIHVPPSQIGPLHFPRLLDQ
jgi:hypothetical protein